MTNDDIDRLAEELGVKHYAGCWPDDQLPLLEDKEGCILNYQSTGEPGSHWTALRRYGNTIYHFDSLGFPPDEHVEELLDKTGMELETEPIRLQRDESHYCGHYCLLFLRSVEEPEDIPLFYDNFSINESPVDLRLNDKIMRDMVIEW